MLGLGLTVGLALARSLAILDRLHIALIMTPLIIRLHNQNRYHIFIYAFTEHY